MLTKVFSLTTDSVATILFIVLIIIMVLHAILGHSKTLLPKLLHIRGIIKDYILVFPNIWDLIYLLALVTIITVITILKVPLDLSQEYTQVGVILTLLVAAMMDIMSMAIGRGDSIQSLENKDQSHDEKFVIIRDIVRIGIFEVLIGFVDLILIFTIESIGRILQEILRTAIYWIFYLFSFNVLALMHKLYLLYNEHYKKD